MFETLCSPTTSKGNIHHIHHASQQNSFFLWHRHVACHRKLVASFVICGGSFLSGCLAGEGKMIDSLMAVNQVERLGPKLPSASKWTSHKSRYRLEDQKYTRQNQMLMCKIIRIMQQQPGKVREYTRALQAFLCQILPVIPFLLRDLSTATAFQQKAVMADWLSWWQKGMAKFILSFKHVSDLKVSRFGNRHSFEIPEPLRKTKSLHFKHLSSPGWGSSNWKSWHALVGGSEAK